MEYQNCNGVILVRTIQSKASSRISMAWPIETTIRSQVPFRRFEPGMSAACPTHSSPTIRPSLGAVCGEAQRHGHSGNGDVGLPASVLRRQHEARILMPISQSRETRTPLKHLAIETLNALFS